MIPTWLRDPVFLDDWLFPAVFLVVMGFAIGYAVWGIKEGYRNSGCPRPGQKAEKQSKNFG